MSVWTIPFNKCVITCFFHDWVRGEAEIKRMSTLSMEYFKEIQIYPNWPNVNCNYRFVISQTVN